MDHIFISGGDFDDQGSVGRCVLPDTVPKGKQLVLETVTGFYFGDGALIGAAFLTVGNQRFAFPWVQCSAPGPTLPTADGPASITTCGFTSTDPPRCNSMRTAVRAEEHLVTARFPALTPSAAIWWISSGLFRY